MRYCSVAGLEGGYDEREFPNDEFEKVNLTMRKIFLALVVCLLCSAVSADVIVLDLSKPAEAIEYNEQGVWRDVYKDEAFVQSQGFRFSHVSSSPHYYNGFVASRSTTVLESANFDDQFGCMARGGVAGEGSPYLVAYWDAYAESLSIERSCEVTFPAPYYTAGFYVCNNPYTYYAIQKGNSYAAKFEQGAWLKLIAHGVDATGNETGTVEHYLTDYRSEKPEEWTLNKSWKWVDLSTLGKVSSLYFTMESSDTGAQGMKTPAYFCFDRLMVLTAPASVDEALAATATVYFDRVASAVRVESAAPVETAVYNSRGALVMRQRVEGTASLDLSGTPSGVYIVRCGGKSLKIVK